MSEPIKLTANVWSELCTIKQEANHIPYKTDEEEFHKVNFWVAMPMADALKLGADCQNTALTERRLIIEKGIDDGSNLLPAVGYIDAGDPHSGHCVLFINTDKGVYAMDINCPSIVPWNECSIKKWVAHATPTGQWETFD